MAVSGSQKTRIGASLSGVAKALSISAKAPSTVTETVLDFGRGLMRGLFRGFSR